MKRNTLFCLLGLMVLVAMERCRGQGETAVPFLLIPASPEGNGMGGIAGTTAAGDPMAVLANPGQVGLASLSHCFLGGLYPSSTTWMPGIQNSDMSYNASAYILGLNLHSIGLSSFGLSIGLAYSRVYFDEGWFTVTSPDGPTPLGSFHAEEYTDNLSLGVGVDYVIKIGFGYTMKSVDSRLAPIDVQRQGRQGVANFSTYDIGLIGEIPVVKVFGRAFGTPTKISDVLEPVFDVSIGYAHNNMGSNFVAYIDSAQADPLPRCATLGLSYKAGLNISSSMGTWEILSGTLAREAEDVLVQRFPPPTDSAGNVIGEPPMPQYLDGSGAIQFLNNVVLGKGNSRITLRKGWQISVGDLVLLRGGSVRGRGESYATSGYGLRLSGLLQLLGAVTPAVSGSPLLRFIAMHLNVCYDHASSTYDDPGNLNDGVTYNGISLLVR